MTDQPRYEPRIVIHRIAFSTLITIFMGLFVVGYSLLKSKQRNDIIFYEQSMYDRAYFEGGKLAHEPPSLRTTIYRKPKIREMSRGDFERKREFEAQLAEVAGKEAK